MRPESERLCGGAGLAMNAGDYRHMLPLGSARLVLRRFATADVTALLTYRNDPEVARFQGWECLGVDEATAFIAKHESQELGSPGCWQQIALALKPTGELIGDCALRIHAADARQATIGITLARSVHGQGFATEALSALLDYLFLRQRLHRVQADTDPENKPAWRLLERLGMRREAHHRQSLWFKGRWADEYVYAILASEWPVTRR